MFGDDSFLSTKIKAKFGTEEYNIELDKLVNSGNTDALLKEFESFKAKELVNANKIGLSQNVKDESGKGGRENNANIIKQFERGDSMIRLDKNNVAVRLKNGTYVTAKNNEVSLPDLDTYEGRSANDYIQFLGGNVTTKNKFDALMKGVDLENNEKRTQAF